MPFSHLLSGKPNNINWFLWNNNGSMDISLIDLKKLALKQGFTTITELENFIFNSVYEETYFSDNSIKNPDEFGLSTFVRICLPKVTTNKFYHELLVATDEQMKINPNTSLKDTFSNETKTEGELIIEKSKRYLLSSILSICSESTDIVLQNIFINLELIQYIAKCSIQLHDLYGFEWQKGNYNPALTHLSAVILTKYFMSIIDTVFDLQKNLKSDFSAYSHLMIKNK